MAEKTAISWCDATFNPWWGCTKVSPACDHCYAERDAKRFAPGRVLWGVGSERRTFGAAHWAAPLKWAKTLPQKLGRRPRVFCASMADVFDKGAPPEERARLFRLIQATPELDWLLLTKRIGNARAMVGCGLASQPNVWLGATVVSQEEADRDIPKLLATPAAVRFLSIEPMLSRVYIEDVPDPTGGVCLKPLAGLRWIGNGQGRCETRSLGGRIDWVIAGGESGPHARPMHPDWARSLRDQCASAGVPFHFKQWGEWRPPADGEEFSTAMGRAQPIPAFIVAPNGTVHCFENDQPRDAGFAMRRVGKAAAGRLLDGVEHNGFPR